MFFSFIGKPGFLVFYIAIDTPIASKIRDDHASRAAKQRFDGRAKKSHKKHGFLNMTINWTGTKGLSNVRSLEEEELNLSTFALFWTFKTSLKP